MSNHLEEKAERRLSEHDARRVLERAIQLDSARLGDTTVAELMRVAQELNIAPSALTEALRELDQPVVTPAPTTIDQPAEHKLSWWRTLSIAAAAFAIGALNGSGSNDGSPLMILSTFGTIALVLKHRRDATPAEFQKDVLALWGGGVIGWVLAEGSVAEGVVYSATLAWLISSTLGGFLTRFKWPWRRTPEPQPLTPHHQSK